MATMYAGPGNVYTQTFDIRANIIASYSRDPKKFKFNDLVTITPVDKPINKWLRIKPEAAMNVTDRYNQSHRWADGAPLPIHLDGGQKHEWLDYFCERFADTFPLGDVTIDTAVWDIVKSQSEALAGRLMTDLAREVYSELGTAGNYDNTATATAAGGGKWDVATSTNRYIQNSLMYAVQEINKSTGNGVSPEDLVLVMSPTIAKQVAASAEVADYMAGSPFSSPFVQGKTWPNWLGNFGMPPELYGIKVIVDPLVRDTAALGATSSKSEVASATACYLIARQGALASSAGGSNFSFIHVFRYKEGEFNVRIVDDTVNLRKLLVVSDYRDVKVVAKEAGFLFTAVVD